MDKRMRHKDIVYISGKMSGLPDEVWSANFAAAATKLRDAGYAVISPAELEGCGKNMTWEDYLKRDLRWLSDCTMIALLPNWKESRGAHLELLVALRLGMPVICAETLEPLDLKHEYEFFCEKTKTTVKSL